MTYGAVYTSMYADERHVRLEQLGGLQPGQRCLLLQRVGRPANHAVDIVGWDDNYAASQLLG